MGMRADRIVVMDAYRIEGALQNTRNDQAVIQGITGLIHRTEAATV